MSTLLSTPARARRFLSAWTAALVLGASAYALAATAARTLRARPALEELSYYPSGAFLRPATLGHEETAADLAWLRAVQYYGAHRQDRNEFERMPHVFRILTELSPRFEPAYVFGAFALAQEGRSFEAGEQLLLKGLEANPRSGALAFELGFLYYVKPGGRDLRKAAEYFQMASRLPGSPEGAARFAAFSREHSGDLRVAYALWQHVFQTTQNRYMRDIAERNMAEISRAIATGQPGQVVRRLAVPGVVVR